MQLTNPISFVIGRTSQAIIYINILIILQNHERETIDREIGFAVHVRIVNQSGNMFNELNNCFVEIHFYCTCQSLSSVIY